MRLTALLTTLLLALGACGGDEPADPAADAPAATEESTAPADDDAADEEDTASDDGASEDGATDHDEGHAAADDGGAEETEQAVGDAGDDPLADGGSGLVLDVGGQRITADPDTLVWGCGTNADASVVSFQVVDMAGNDISVNYQADGETTASLTLADGTTWSAVEGGTAEVAQEDDGVFSLAIEVDSGDGESSLLEARIRCA